MAQPEQRFTIAVDFDGVLHSYLSGWQGADIIPDPPVEGAIDWLNEIGVAYDIAILTTRAREQAGAQAVGEWLNEQGVEIDFVVTAVKEPALLYIDDRAWRFSGRFPNLKTIRYAKPWKAGDPLKQSARSKIQDIHERLHHLEGKQARLKAELRQERERAEVLAETLRQIAGRAPDPGRLAAAALEATEEAAPAA